jgi:ParB family chromosome partitioning protein
MIKMRGLTQKQLADLLGITQSAVSNKLRLLQLSINVQEKISKYGLTERHARELLRISDEEKQIDVIERVNNEKLSVARCAVLVDMVCTQSVALEIGRCDRLRATYLFIEGVKKSIQALSSIGISATYKENYYKQKVYVTICISEDL